MAVVSMKLSIGYSGINERSHLGCPFEVFDLHICRISYSAFILVDSEVFDFWETSRVSSNDVIFHVYLGSPPPPNKK